MKQLIYKVKSNLTSTIAERSSKLFLQDLFIKKQLIELSKNINGVVLNNCLMHVINLPGKDCSISKKNLS